MVAFVQLQSEPSQTLRQALQPLKQVKEWASGDVLFQRGSRAHGIYLVEKGSVRLYLDGALPEAQAVGFAGAGAILGLPEVIGNHVYSTTAIAAEELTASFVPKANLLRFLQHDCGYCMQVVQQLSEDLNLLFQIVREQKKAMFHARGSYLPYVH